MTEKFADAIVDVLKRVIEGPRIGGRFEALEQRIAALEARPHVKWAGIYVENKTYQEGDLVTRSGLWLAMGDTRATPGTPDSKWKLIVKQGHA